MLTKTQSPSITGALCTPDRERTQRRIDGGHRLAPIGYRLGDTSALSTAARPFAGVDRMVGVDGVGTRPRGVPD